MTAWQMRTIIGTVSRDTDGRPCWFGSRARGAGQIEGTVLDEQGGVLPGVTVTLRNEATGVQRVAVTEADGRYRFPALGPGRYSLRAELSGFAVQEVPRHRA